MPIIISATDFSATGNNAVEYACKLALDQNAHVIVIHSFIFPVMFSEIPLPPNLINEAQQEAENQMNKLVDALQLKYKDLAIIGKVIYGDILHTIDEITEKNKPWLITIGNSSFGENTTWPDSTLNDAIKRLKYPVLAVPPEIGYKPVHKLCFAFDNQPENSNIALEQLKNITIRLNADLHVLNAQSADKAGTPINDIDSTAKNILAAAKPNYHVISNGNVNTTVQDFVAKNDIDWLILLPRKHSFFEGLFHKSQTKNIVHHTHIPILALHEEEA